MYKYALCLAMLCCACRAADNPAAWQKVRFQFDQLDKNGLYGPPDGKVGLNYEFCIPAGARYWRTVQRIDTTARPYEGRGRIGCQPGQQLVVGTTNQPNYKRTLYRLANLPFVARIEQTVWE
jgi:hypothetical protein